MSTRLKTIIIIATSLLGIAIALPLSAQITPTNLWRVNSASSTIAPYNSGLQVPCANIVGGCSSSSGASTTYTVCASGCDFSSIQTAMDTASSSGGGAIFVKAGTYTIGATTTFGGSDIHVIGAGNATVIQFNGSSTPYAFANNTDGIGGTIHYRNELGNMEIVSTAVGQGTCIILDKFEYAYIHDINCVSANGGVYANANNAFQNTIERVNVSPVGPSNFGFSFNGHANDNSLIEDGVVSDASGTTKGIIINGTGGTWISNAWIFNAATSGIGIDIQGSSSSNNTILNSWLENNYINVRIATSSPGNAIIGSHLSVGGLTDLQDSGSSTYVQSYINFTPVFTYNGANVALTPGTNFNTSPSPEDYAFKAWDFDPVATVNTGTSVPTSTVFGATIVPKYAITVSKIRFALIAAGATTTNCYFGIYQNGVLLASSTDQSSALLSSNDQSASFATTTLTAGVAVDIAVIIGNASTSPQIIRGVSNSVSNQLTKRFWTADSATTTLPQTLGSKTALSNSFWFGLQ